MNQTCRLFVMLLVVSALARAQNDEAALGRKLADFRFESVVMNGEGFVTGDSFLGRPVLYEFWGFR